MLLSVYTDYGALFLKLSAGDILNKHRDKIHVWIRSKAGLFVLNFSKDQNERMLYAKKNLRV